MAGCKFSARFWGDPNNKEEDFRFTGSFTDPKALRITQPDWYESSDSEDDQWEVDLEVDWGSDSGDGRY